MTKNQDNSYLETDFRKRAINNQKALDDMNSDPKYQEYDRIVRESLIQVRR